MNSFEFDISENRNININLECLECGENFSTEIDADFEGVKYPYSKCDTLYCVNCEASYDYTVKINFDYLELVFIDDLKGFISYSTSAISLEEYNQSNLFKSKQFYFSQIDRLKKILSHEINEYITDQALNRLVFSGVITSLETFLNEIFVTIVFERDYTLEKFVSEYEPYRKEQIPLNEIFSKFNGLESRVRDELNYFIYHNMPKLISVFNIFNFKLNECSSIKAISKAIKTRHDFIHRSGLDRDNNFQEVSKEEVLLLISKTTELVEYIDFKIKNKCYLFYSSGDDSPF
ncbi:hypothetical protein [Joostella sp.]|uniref:hypothetical protein n=1 Tax=Joostella sp. TaxID=2231138 RepID=UPI003A921FBB